MRKLFFLSVLSMIALFTRDVDASAPCCQPCRPCYYYRPFYYPYYYPYPYYFYRPYYDGYVYTYPFYRYYQW